MHAYVAPPALFAVLGILSLFAISPMSVPGVL